MRDVRGGSLPFRGSEYFLGRVGPACGPPTADPRLRGGSQVVISPGIEFYFSDGMLGGNRFALEFGFPVHQSFQGPQLESDWSVRSGWSVTF